MSLLLTVKKIQPELITTARIAVLVSMHTAWENTRNKGLQPQEPDFVASLVMYGTKLLEMEWSKLLKPYKTKIAITGVYCHQTPKVSFSGMQKTSCEIGDLLWCHIHTDKQGDIMRNAILYQAKKSCQQPYHISNNEYDQMNLYSKWPEFIYTNAGKLRGEKRLVKPAAPRLGAQYLLIDDRPPEEPASGLLGIPGTYPVGSCIAQNPLIDHADLGLEIVRSLELRSGNPFDDRKNALQETGWSRVIWDLLEVSVEKAFRRSRSGYFNQPRVHGTPPSTLDGCFFKASSETPQLFISILGKENASRMLYSDIEKPPGNQEGEWFDEGGGGVSFIYIETSELSE